MLNKFRQDQYCTKFNHMKYTLTEIFIHKMYTHNYLLLEQKYFIQVGTIKSFNMCAWHY